MKLVYVANHTNPFEHINLDLLTPALNQPIVDIFFKGKAFFIRLAHNISLKVHFMMQGKWLINNYNLKELMEYSPEDKSKALEYMNSAKINHTELEFLFVDEEQGIMTQLFYVNVRFGEINIFTTEYELNVALSKYANGFLGRFILSHNEWMTSITNLGKTRMLRLVLLDQDVLCSGIGNYLRAEIMYYCKLHPDVTIGQLTHETMSNLYYICLATVRGHYDGTLEKVIYAKRICPNGHEIIKPKKGGRTMHYCPVEQIIGL